MTVALPSDGGQTEEKTTNQTNDTNQAKERNASDMHPVFLSAFV